MAQGKKPHQLNPRNNHQQQPPQPLQPELTPEQELRRRAMYRLDILPPYQGVHPQELVLQTEGGQEMVKVFKGLTKREHLMAMFVAAQIQKEGLPLQDAQCLHYARLALLMSEAVLQTVSKQRGDDINEVIRDMAQEAAAAAATAAQPTTVE